MSGNLNTNELNEELNSLYDDIEYGLQELVEAGQLAVDIDDIDVYDSNWLKSIMEDVEDLPGTDSISVAYDELKELLELKESVGDDFWNDGGELLLENDKGYEELAEQYVSEYCEAEWFVNNYRRYIDFKSIGEEIAMDYSSVDFRGESYLYQE